MNFPNKNRRVLNVLLIVIAGATFFDCEKEKWIQNGC